MNFDAVLIAGPTASGKTQAAIALAEAIGGTIVNADSMQVYRELPVLSAQPSAAERSRVPHGLFGHISAFERYSVGRYIADASSTLNTVRRQERIPVFVGGTGLYFRALVHGLADLPAVPLPVRNEIRARLKEIGQDALYSELQASDPLSASRIRPSDTQRLLRATEVFAATGRPFSDWQRDQIQPVLHSLKLAKVVLDVPRAELRHRIAARFERMLHLGASEEAANLAELNSSLPAAKALGLRELLAAARGEISETEASQKAILRTCQFAKRQMTWFRNQMADWVWTTADPVNGKFISQIMDDFKRKLLDGA